MVVCIIALVVFGILGIFSATHRAVAKEAFECVLRKATLRPCNTGLDSRLKMIVSLKVMKQHSGAGKFIHKHFEAISFVFMLLMLSSIAFSAIGIYNLWAFGNCNGENIPNCGFLNRETNPTTTPLPGPFPPAPS